MNVKRRNFLLGLAAVVMAGVMGTGNAAALAAPVQVKVNMPYLRCIGAFAGQRQDDQVYVVVTGVAKGAEVNRRIPEKDTFKANTKEPAIEEEKPATLWEGELADGEFALLTVVLFQGKGDDAAKAFLTKLNDAAKGAAGLDKKTLASADELKALAAAAQKAQREVVTKVKETLSREKETDHYGGLFNVLVWNNNGTVVKRLDPVGLTFGEHRGNNEKIYTKIKYTRNNVNVKDPSDDSYYPQEMPPITEDKHTVRVKMLETEYVTITRGGKERKARNVTDYLADVQVLVNGKPVEWKLGGENLGQMQIQHYWDFAE